MRWVGTWTSSPVLTEGIAFDNQTLRVTARASVGGSSVRVRLSNACGRTKLAIGAAHIALRGKGAAIAAGSDRKLTFARSGSCTIPAGALVVSDPVELYVPPLADLAVSVHLPVEVREDFQITGHGNSRQTHYLSPPGDHCAAADMPVLRSTEDCCFVAGIEVLAPDGTGGIVCFGDSLTDGNISSVDGFHRWPDQLARRLAARRGGRAFGVMNQGIGGNRILHDTRGENALKRFDRDALAQPGATHVVVFLGINDIRYRVERQHEMVGADEMIAGLAQLAVRARANGLAVFGGTLLPFENETFVEGAWTEAGEAKRRAVNRWIRTGGAFDAVFDFERALRDPAHPARMLPVYDCGDHLHPSDRGYERLGDEIDLALFDRIFRKRD